MAHDGINAEPGEKAIERAKKAGAANPPSGNGLSSRLQPSGTLPGGGPGGSVGSIGSGGGATGGASTGNAA
jgi:hypothetical protein